MLSLHTKVFASLCAVAALPSVGLCLNAAINPDFPIQFYLGLIVTWSAVICTMLMLVATVSLACDLLQGSDRDPPPALED